jgi:hypothetical protein
MSSVKKIINYRGRPTEVEVITPTTPARRKVAKIAETWVQIPHARGLKLAKQTKCPVLAVLLALEVAVHNARSNQVKLTNNLLEQYGITRQSKVRGLRQLGASGIILVEWNGQEAPAVIHHWYTEDGELKP